MAPAVSKLLPYPCLLSVLNEMDPGVSARLSIFCPSIRTINKSARFKIRELGIYSRALQLNNTHFAIVVVRKNELSGKLTRWKFKFNSTSEEYSQSEKVQSLEREEDILENQLKMEETRLQAKRTEDISVNVRERMELISSKLLDVKLKLHKVRPLPYTDYLQLTITSHSEVIDNELPQPQTARYVETSKYELILKNTQSTSLAMERLIQCVFGGRKSVIIHRIAIGIPRRAPERFNIMIDGGDIQSVVRTLANAVFSETAIRIEWVYADANNLDMGCPIFRKVQKLNILGEQIYENITALRVRDVHFTFNVIHFLKVIPHWVREGTQEIGTIWSCEFWEIDVPFVRLYFDRIPGIFEDPGKPVQVRINSTISSSTLNPHLIFTMSETSELHAYCEGPYKEEEDKVELYEFILKVLPR